MARGRGVEDEAPAQQLRLDKWLWHARFARSRTLAGALVAEGRVRINAQRCQTSHRAVRPGDILTLALPHATLVVRVLALGTRREGAPQAALLYEQVESA